MAKIFGREVSPVLLGAATLLVAGVVYTVLTPPDTGTVKTVTTKSSSKGSVKNSLYLPVDYKTHFAPMTADLKDAFHPLIARAAAGGAMGELTGEKGDWVYSGMAVLNGVKQGLLENRTDGTSNYVNLGQHWRNSTVTDIEPETITLKGPNGPVTMQAGQDNGAKATADAGATDAGVSPLTLPGNLMGPIGQVGLGAQASAPGAQGPLTNIQLQPAPVGPGRTRRAARAAAAAGQQGNP